MERVEEHSLAEWCRFGVDTPDGFYLIKKVYGDEKSVGYAKVSVIDGHKAFTKIRIDPGPTNSIFLHSALELDVEGLLIKAEEMPWKFRKKAVEIAMELY